MLGVALPRLRVKIPRFFTIYRHLNALISRKKWATRSREYFVGLEKRLEFGVSNILRERCKRA
jgi:hypothetical protein